jgi:glycerophosphoryl diester phosphodiesterase
LKAISSYANGIGPDKNYFTPETYKKNAKWIQEPALLLGKPLVDEAHRHNLLIHPYTFRNPYEDKTLPQFDSDVISEYLYFLDLGIDGYFTEWAGTPPLLHSL